MGIQIRSECPFLWRDMEKQNKSEKKNFIWKTKHTPLKDRKTSSGLTFWPEKVESDGDGENADQR